MKASANKSEKTKGGRQGMLKEYHKPFCNLYDTLAASAAKYPEKAAIIDDDEEVSYRELLKRTDELAVVLNSKVGAVAAADHNKIVAGALYL